MNIEFTWLNDGQCNNDEPNDTWFCYIASDAPGHDFGGEYASIELLDGSPAFYRFEVGTTGRWGGCRASGHSDNLPDAIRDVQTLFAIWTGVVDYVDDVEGIVSVVDWLPWTTDSMLSR